MRKRLRKKLRKGEFRELCFFVAFRVEAQREEVIDRFILEAIEANALLFGGSDRGGFVTSAALRGSATEDDRAKVRAWLEAQSEISEVTIGELRDAWHGWSLDFENA